MILVWFLFCFLPVADQADLSNSTRLVLTFQSSDQGLLALDFLESGYYHTVFTVVKQYGRRLVLDVGRPVDVEQDTEIVEEWLDSAGLTLVSLEVDLFVGHSQMVEAEIGNVTSQSYLALNASGVEWHFLDSEPYSLQMEQVWNSLASSPPALNESRIPLAVLDSGLASLVQGPGYFESLIPGYDFVSDPSLSLDGDGRDPDPTDPGDAGPGCPVSSWHGTKMAAAMCLLHNVVPGVHSMLPNRVIALQPVRVLGECSTGYANDVADAIVWASGGQINGIGVNPHPALVVSMSFSGIGDCPSFLQSAVDFATSCGIVLVAAAGNKGGDVSDYFPANCQGVIAVGASTRQGTLADYSNSGVGLAVLAAGGDVFDPIVTVFVDKTTLLPSLSTGTSFSAAFTSSLVALKEFIAMNQGNISASSLIFLLNNYAACIATINSVGPYIPPYPNGVRGVESGGRFWADQWTFLKFIIYMLQHGTVNHKDNLEVYIPASYSSKYVVGAANPSGCSNMSSLSVSGVSNVQNWARSCGTQGNSSCSVSSPFIWINGPVTNSLDLGGNSGIYLNDGNVYSFITNSAASEVNVYFKIDLGQPRFVVSGAAWNRYGMCSSGLPYNGIYINPYCYDYINKFRIYIGNDSITPLNNILCFTDLGNAGSSLYSSTASFKEYFYCTTAITGRYAYIYHPNAGYMNVAELEVYGPSCCEQGAYNNGTQCSYCPLGMYGTSPGMTNSATCTKCAMGTYSTGSGFSSCTSCAAGSYSTVSNSSSSVDCSLCFAGTYSTGTGMGSSGTCSGCVLGKYSSSSGAVISSTCQSCAAGTYSVTNKATSSSVCTLCLAGTYSTGFGMTIIVFCATCSAGSYSSASGAPASATCSSCQAGAYSTVLGATIQSTCSLCQAGRYSTASGAPASAICAFCPAGAYSTASGASAPVTCALCQSGAYSTVLGAAVSATCSLCLAGKYSTASGAPTSSVCVLCSAGAYSTVLGAVVSNNCYLCQAGAYSVEPGAIFCPLCQAGKYTTASGASVCVLCDAGAYSTVLGAIASNTCSLCQAGAYSTVLGATTCSLCQAGKYSTASGVPASSACVSCSAGAYSTVSGANIANNCSMCAFGTYSSGLGMVTCLTCNSGTYSTGTGMSSSSTCLYCDPGTFSMPSAVSSCIACAAGSYTINPGTTTCSLCNAFAYSTGVGISNSSACISCGPGFFVTNSNSGASSSAICRQCFTGTYSTSIIASYCPACRGGSYSSGLGMTSSSACTLCTAGTYAYCVLSQGSYVPVSGMSRSVDACIGCPAGSYSSGSGTTLWSSACISCDKGSYSSSTGISACTLCVPGTYSANSSSYCSQCAAGSYGTGSGMNDSTSACVGCQAGSYNSGSGSSDVSACQLCETGTYSSGLGYSACQLCMGCSSCPTGSTSDPTVCDCPAGYYRNPLAGCTQCPPNTNSSQGSTTALGCRCFAGYVCTYTKVIRISLLMDFINTPAPTTATALLNSALMASVAQAAGVPVSNIQVVGITQVPQGRRRALKQMTTYEVVCLVSGVGPHSRRLRSAGFRVWQGEEFTVRANRVWTTGN